MKVGIITLHRVLNYGSVLQVYALQRYLSKLGHDSQVIDYAPDRFSNKYIFTNIKKEKWKKSKLHEFLYITAVFLKRYKFKKPIHDFLYSNVKMTNEKYRSLDELNKIKYDYDIFLTGSDQVWNSIYNQKIDSVYFLDFVPKEKKRVAYAGSFGRSSLSNIELEETKDLILKYDYISVRESSALDLIRLMGRSDGINVVDPALLLDIEEWEKVALKNTKTGNYLLLYQLNEGDFMLEVANKVAKSRNLEVIQIGFNKRKRPGIEELFCNIKPEKFISLFLNADFVVTDSFHGTAFSINFNKQFAVILPRRFSTRLTSILEIIDQTRRVINKIEDVNNLNENINYNYVNKVLKNERSKAEKYFKEAFSI